MSFDLTFNDRSPRSIFLMRFAASLGATPSTKLPRETLDEARPALARELADVQTYLDLLAFRAGVNLGEATVAKWNEVSERVGVDLRLEFRE